jgi:hypothetical protein
MLTLWGKITSKYAFYSSADPVVKKSAMEYYQLLKHAFQQRATTDTKVSGSVCSVHAGVHESWL